MSDGTNSPPKALSKSAKRRQKKKDKEQAKKEDNNSKEKALDDQCMETDSPKKFDENAFNDVSGADQVHVEEDDGLDVDAVIKQLLSIRSKNPLLNTKVDLDIDTINKLIERMLKLVKS